MKKITFLLTLSLLVSVSFAQSTQGEEEAVKKTIDALFEGMRKADTALLSSAFDEKCILQTIVNGKDGSVRVATEEISAFVKSMAGQHPLYDERIRYTKILTDGNLASVWTDYRFYLGDKFSHCGVNSFQLLKTAKGWKIIYLIDTRRKDQCNF